MISVRELSKDYAGSPAVDRLSFEIRPGEVVGFLGPNGAGKTTTLRMLSGFLPPSSGRAEVAGFDVARSSLEVRRRIGYLPENNPLYEDMDVPDYLEWCAAARAFAGAGRDRAVRSAVEACSLGDALAKPIGSLSKGFRQRVGLAAAILHDPEILLLDEPTSGLDPNQALEVRALIARLKASKTVLLSTHILSEVEASCDRVLILHRGRIAASGTPLELSRAAGPERLLLTLRRGELGVDEVRPRVAALPGVAAVEAREARAGELEFEVRGAEGPGDLREPLFRLAVAQGWTLLGLRRLEASLASVFRESTLS